MNRPKLRASVSVVKLQNDIIEFFLTNTRQQVRIKVNSEKILEVLLQLDGTMTIDEIIKINNIDNEVKEHFIKFLNYLESKGVIKDSGEVITKEDSKYRRIINFIEDFSSNTRETQEMWKNIKESHVIIIGLGAVGSWVSALLVQNGVGKLTLIDNDVVEITNLHRQFGFSEKDIGLLKTDVIERRLIEYNENIEVKKINKFLNESLLDDEINDHVDLIVNCADKPNVDTTSLWVGEYCMKNNIPHIIGGGYNLHLSLIGQTIIPYKSACVKCFESELKKLNEIDTKSLRKLNIKNRKIGSFGPMCSIISSMIAIESVKVLTKKIIPSNLNRRGEFNIYNMDIKYHNIYRNTNCIWCGDKGIYGGINEKNRGFISERK
ncbi:ThiF family adenylyltransferase [Paraclostridium sordellii]|uniref:ThiF family adenylyltransferase n=1 Tax=Paraclostridium sordellii TaxID=1505 RepID=UPI0005DE61D6|nr:ThiF family adenylyltransferase [Paeniclostridium sordellii]CEN80702.1 dinucleotide-utilizing enzyme [[Clostridium] sordellii] [Paeniclostridium sordellii]